MLVSGLGAVSAKAMAMAAVVNNSAPMVMSVRFMKWPLALM
jgi:hypothetical protein